MAGRRAGAARRCGARVRGVDREYAAFGGSRMPRASAFCVALMHSLKASSEEAIFDCICVVCMCKTMSDGRERVHVMFVCHERVVGTVGGVPIGSGQKLVFSGQVYLTPAG